MMQLIEFPASIPGAALDTFVHEDKEYFYCREHDAIKPFYIFKEGKCIATCQECFTTGAIMLGDIGEAGHDEKLGHEGSSIEPEKGNDELAN